VVAAGISPVNVNLLSFSGAPTDGACGCGCGRKKDDGGGGAAGDGDAGKCDARGSDDDDDNSAGLRMACDSKKLRRLNFELSWTSSWAGRIDMGHASTSSTHRRGYAQLWFG